MPRHVQIILQEEADRAVDWMHMKLTQWEDEDIEKLKKLGVSIHILSEKEREKWKIKLKPFQERQLSSMGEFGKEVKEIVDEVNSKYPY